MRESSLDDDVKERREREREREVCVLLTVDPNYRKCHGFVVAHKKRKKSDTRDRRKNEWRGKVARVLSGRRLASLFHFTISLELIFSQATPHLILGFIFCLFWEKKHHSIYNGPSDFYLHRCLGLRSGLCPGNI